MPSATLKTKSLVCTFPFDLHTTFDKPGVYRGWIQYQSKGKVYTSDFVFNVAEGKADDMKNMKHDDMKEIKH